MELLSCFFHFFAPVFQKKKNYGKKVSNFDSDNLLPILLQNQILVMQHIRIHQDEHFDISFANIAL